MTSIALDRGTRIRDDADVCAGIARAHARTFSLAANLLPADKRRGAFALYAFCRRADDIVDREGGAVDAREALDVHRQRLREALRGQPRGAVFRELAWTVERFGVPAAPLEELLDGVARDLCPPHIRDDAALRAYCEGVAGSVGEMCTFVFGVHGTDAVRARAIVSARTLGVAMQLTNILRDVGEDARRGRVYLPDTALREAGISRDDITDAPSLAASPAWQTMIAARVRDARELYAVAEEGVALLETDARACAMACARGYALILDAIEQQHYDTINRRATVSRWAKGRLMLALVRDATSERQKDDA